MTPAWMHAGPPLQQPTTCKLSLVGDSKSSEDVNGTISAISLSCDGPVSMHLGDQALSKLGAKKLGSVKQVECSEDINCIISVCDKTHVVFNDVAIKDIHAPGLTGILCASDTAQLDVKSATVVGNTASKGIMHVRGNATLRLTDSMLARNKASMEVDGSTPAGMCICWGQTGRALLTALDTHNTVLRILTAWVRPWELDLLFWHLPPPLSRHN
jgi:hypothetical protein